MRAPAFWYAPKPTWIAWALSPLGWIYGTLTARRMAKAGISASVPVICVGNLVAGGAGKTPTVLALAAMLRDAGRTPFALSRGYGGSLHGPVRIVGQTPAETGDEPLLLARNMPVIVARNRPSGAALAVTEGADIIIMDDGLQNPSLTKTLRLAVIDGEAGIGNGLCLPAGPLRAPLNEQMRHVDALILIGAGAAGERVAAQASKPVHRARLVPDAIAAQQLRGSRVLALAGIGRPKKFSVTLREAGADVVAARSFPDHHPFTAADVRQVLSIARDLRLTVATTQKDWVKLEPLWPSAEPIIIVPVTLVFDAPDEIAALLAAHLP
jgi:tetraacyldisaccharide 4'-kinase